VSVGHHFKERSTNTDRLLPPLFCFVATYDFRGWSNCLRLIPQASIFDRMTDVTRILSAIEQGDPQAAEQLLPLVYHELRKLAAQRMTQEAPGQTLQATALVHEAYLRLVDVEKVQHWNSRGHFFAAAAEAMRRILVENARRNRSLKRGGARTREKLDEENLLAPQAPDELLALDDALSQLAMTDAQAAELVKLRYFAGLTVKQAAEALGVAPRTADFLWAFARAWLLRKLDGEAPGATGAAGGRGEKI
jgi:RNA polymerase sigma factor (TIGR02999 family)